MITNKDVRVENGNLVLNGDKYPLDGQSPEAIMEIVEDNSDTTPTENSTAPITSGGVFTALAGKEDTLTFDTTPTDESTNPVTSGGVFTALSALGTTVDNSNTVIEVGAVQGQSENSKVKYIRFGKMIIAEGYIVGGSSLMSSGTKVFEGLPRPAYQKEIFAVQGAGEGYKRFLLNTSGEIYCHSALTQTYDIGFYLCYIASN